MEYVPKSDLLVRTYDAISPNGRPQLFVYRADSLELLWDLSVAPFVPLSLAVSADGRYAAIGGYQNVKEHQCEIQIIDLQSRAVVYTIPTERWVNGVEHLSWQPNGSLIAAGGTVGSGDAPAVQVFDVSSKTEIAREVVGSAHLQALRYSPDGRFLIECGLPKHVEVWDANHQTLLQQIPAKDCYSLAVSRDSKQLVVSDRKYLSIWRFL